MFDIDITNLPDDPAELKKIIIELVVNFQQEQARLQEQIRALQHQLFGRRSEKRPAPPGVQPLPLFDMPEPEEIEPAKPERVEVKPHSRRKPRRAPLPDDLPRVVVEHDLPEDEKICGCGKKMPRIGEEVSEQLEYQPAKLFVVRHVRPVYACSACDGEAEEHPVKVAPMPPQIIPKSIATAGLLAAILNAKFLDHLPFYRQEKQFARLGIDISRVSMSEWAIKAAAACRPLLNLLIDTLLEGPLVGADETTVQVLKQPGRSPTAKSYMWVFRGGGPGQNVVIYHYAPSRSSTVAAEFLAGYQGNVQTDGYAGYDFLDDLPGVIHAGCWSHARRKFHEVISARPSAAKQAKRGSANEAMDYIQDLYRIERQAREAGLSPEEIKALRQEQAVPILERFHVWLQQRKAVVPPKSLLGKAIKYTLDQWPRLVAYTKDGRIPIDNNLVENAVRPFALGRKNWLFAGSVEGAESSALIYSLIQTAKANGRDPASYLRYVLYKIPYAETVEDLEALLPWNLDTETLRNFDPLAR